MKKQKMEIKEKNMNNGITLIALVITIIVLLILAGITIATLTGENGILTKTTDAKKENEITSVKEQAKLDISNWIAERVKNGEDVTLDDGLVKSILETENASNTQKYYKELQEDKIITPSGYEILYTDLYTKSEMGTGNIKEYTKDGVPIPNGFYYVGGTKEEGVVISDKEADANQGTSWEKAKSLIGNQFVWVPVENDDDFKTYEGYSNGSIDSKLDSCEEPYSGGYENEDAEYAAMKKSVLQYNGFYVGRYEAGVEGTRTSGISDDVVIKQGKNVYNNIEWSTGNDITKQEGGAVQKAKEFAEENDYKFVTSTLIYGVQWDAIMLWIDPAYKTQNCEENSIIRNSAEKGYYNQSKSTVTGSSSNYETKNIYDLAGNIWEWTMESCYGYIRTLRGGCYSNSGSNSPISNRETFGLSDELDYTGFRIALYL